MKGVIMNAHEQFKADVSSDSTILNKIKTDLDYCESFYLTLCSSDFKNANGDLFKSYLYKNANILTDLRALGEIPTIFFSRDKQSFTSDPEIISEIASIGWTVVAEEPEEVEINEIKPEPEPNPSQEEIVASENPEDEYKNE